MALWSFVPLPILTGLNRLYSGLLIQSRRTDLVSLAMGLGMAFQIGAVAVLLQVEWIGQNPIVLPIIAVYLSEIVALVVVLAGYRRYVSAGLPKDASAFLRWGYIVGFSGPWPWLCPFRDSVGRWSTSSYPASMMVSQPWPF